MRIIVIGINYAPEPTGSAPYTSGIAEMLAEKGNHVEALVGIPHYPWWKVLPQDKYRLRSKETLNGVYVNHFRHFVPKRQTTIRRLAWELSFFLNALFFKIRNKPNLIIVSVPSLSAGLLGIHLAKKFKVPLVVIMQDLVGKAISQSGLQIGKLIGKVILILEARIVQKSNQICIVSKKFKEYVSDLGATDESIVYFPNWTHILSPTKSFNETRISYGWDTKTNVILHTGNIGLKQDLTNILHTAKLLEEDIRYKFVICGDGNQKEFLRKKAEGLSNVQFLDPVSETEYPNLLQAANILLVNERDSVGDMSLPSKLTSYMFASKPIIAAVSENGACANLLNMSNGAGIVVQAGNPQKLATAIQQLSNDKERQESMSRSAKAYSNKYLSREKASENLDNVLKKVKIL